MGRTWTSDSGARARALDAATSAVTEKLGDFWVAILGRLLRGPTHNPNDPPGEEVITSLRGVLNAPPLEGVVGEGAVHEGPTMAEPPPIAHMSAETEHHERAVHLQGGGPARTYAIRRRWFSGLTEHGAPHIRNPRVAHLTRARLAELFQAQALHGRPPVRR